MKFLQPTSWADALAAKAEHPQAVAIAGGTDLMVDINFDRVRPDTVLDLGYVPELSTWHRDNGRVRLGAGVTYSQVIDELAELLPCLAQASRTVGSPQIRNRGTVGGNLGSASPAGDAHPPLLACGAMVVAASTRGVRHIPVRNFYTGPKRNALHADELIEAVTIPIASGPQQFSKVGTRNAMVIAVSSFALILDPSARRVGTGIGSAGPTPLPATEAERFLQEVLDDQRGWEARTPLSADVLHHFGQLVASAARPIDDIRSTAGYRRHSLAVMARRTLSWAWADYCEGRPG
jgi:CO/xanthine dehydrogenase FAD-binding subunit